MASFWPDKGRSPIAIQFIRNRAEVSRVVATGSMKRGETVNASEILAKMRRTEKEFLNHLFEAKLRYVTLRPYVTSRRRSRSSTERAETANRRLAVARTVYGPPPRLEIRTPGLPPPELGRSGLESVGKKRTPQIP